MDPKIANLVEENGTLSFQLNSCNVSFANAIRRTIISDIPTLVFRALPYAESTINILNNTSRLNNEIIRHRLSCVPIHEDTSIPLDKYKFVIDIKNDTDEIIIVTTGDIKVIDEQTGKEINKADRDRLFPKDPITDDYIQLVRLNPKITDQLPGEALHLEAKATIATAGQDGAFNVASVASYAYSIDTDKQKQVLAEHLKNLKAEYISQGIEKEALNEALTYAERSWHALEGKRVTKENSFEFFIETVGVFNNEELVRKACDIIVERFEELNLLLSNAGSMVDIFEEQAGEFVMVKLENYDFTVAKAIEAILYQRNWLSKDKLDGLDFCATIRPHPHINEIYLRLHYSNILPKNISLIEHSRNVVAQAGEQAKEIFKNIKKQLPK